MMQTDTDEDLLRRLAAGGTIDYDIWPRLLCTIVSQIETICHNEFSIPLLPPPKPIFTAVGTLTRHSGRGYGPGAVDGNSGPQEPSNSDADMPSIIPEEDATSNNKENTQPASSGHQAASGMSSFPSESGGGASSPPSSAIGDNDIINGVNGNSSISRLPPQLADLLEMIISALTINFSEYPPHTIQRLSELVLAPRQHYRNLAPYLHALLRIVNVTSGINIYPLPPAIPDMSAMTLLANGTDSGNQNYGASTTAITNSNNDEDNGNGSQSTAASLLGSDESLGGALLTPIPWLRRQSSSINGGGNSSDDGDNENAANTKESATNSDDDDENEDEDDSNGRSMPHSFSSGGGGGGSSGELIHGSVMSDDVSGPVNGEGSVSHSITSNGTPTSQRQQHQPQADVTGGAQSSQSQTQDQAQQQHTTQHTHHSRSRIEGHVRTESTETIDGPNGVGSIETVSVSVNGIPSHGAMVAAVQLQQQQRGITQGELLRQEQTAGVVPVSQLARVMAVVAGGGGGVGSSSSNINNNSYSGTSHSFHQNKEEEEEHARAIAEDVAEDGDAHHGDTDMADAEGTGSGDGGGGGNGDTDDVDEVPHARGPQEIGPADTGPQKETQTADSAKKNCSIIISRASDGTVITVHELDVEAAVGRKADTIPSRAMSATTIETAATIPVPAIGASVTNTKDTNMAESSSNMIVSIAATAAATAASDGNNDCDTASASAPPTPSKREAGDEPSEAAPTVKKRKDSRAGDRDGDGGGASDGDCGDGDDDNNDSDSNDDDGMASAPSNKTVSPGA